MTNLQDEMFPEEADVGGILLSQHDVRCCGTYVKIWA